MSATMAQSITLADNAVVMIVSDEVEMVMRAKFRQLLKFLYVELCRREIMRRLSQDLDKSIPTNHHIENEADLWAFYFDDVKTTVDLDIILEVGGDLVKLFEVAPGSQDFVLDFPRMKSYSAMMIADDMLCCDRHELPIVKFVNEMCDVKENPRELSLEIFNEFVYAVMN